MTSAIPVRDFESESSEEICVTLSHDDAVRLRRAEEQMRRVVEGSAQGIIVCTRDDVLYMNDSFAKLQGYATRREYVSAQACMKKSIHPDDLENVTAHLEARIRGEDVVA